MQNQRPKELLAFTLLFVPAFLVAWFHHAIFPAVVAGTLHLWGPDVNSLPMGFELLRQFGSVLYLLPLAVIAVYALSWRLPALRTQVALSLCGGVMVVICLIYAALLVTPALKHGTYLVTVTRANNRPAVEAGISLGLQIEDHTPGATEAER